MFFTIIAFEINNLWFKSQQFIVSLLFFVVFLVIFQFLHQATTVNQQSLFLLATILSSLLVILGFFQHFCKDDISDGTIEQMLMLFANFEKFVLAKILASWLGVVLPIIVGAVFLAILQNFNLLNIAKLVAIIAIATLTISFISAMSGVLTNHFQSLGYMAIIALPLILPILLLGYLAFHNDFWQNYQVLLAISCFISTTTTFATAKIVKLLAV
jgi:heme exporter protein CcmB